MHMKRRQARTVGGKCRNRLYSFERHYLSCHANFESNACPAPNLDISCYARLWGGMASCAGLATPLFGSTLNPSLSIKLKSWSQSTRSVVPLWNAPHSPMTRQIDKIEGRSTIRPMPRTSAGTSKRRLVVTDSPGCSNVFSGTSAPV